MSDYDPRQVDLYDGDNPAGTDHDFYRALADERGARSILDLGCGTGLLTVSLASEGRRVVGVDPSAAMLDYARGRPGASNVEWILGDSRDTPEESFDYAVMTGNVAQHILDPEWPRTLGDLRARLQVGGTLAFDSRNPAAQEWEQWATDEREFRNTVHGPLEEWAEISAPHDGVVTARFHNRFLATGDTVTEDAAFAFRDHASLRGQLMVAGFEIAGVYGDWDRRPLDDASRLLIFVAQAR